MSSEKVALLGGLASTLYMTGVVAFVHHVHYPLFGAVGGDAFRGYHAAHVRRTGRVVALPMVVELAAGGYLALRPPPRSGGVLAWSGFAAAVAAWAVTAVASVPCHDRLAGGFDARAHRRLLTTNRVRVAAWAAHAVILLAMTARALG